MTVDAPAYPFFARAAIREPTVPLQLQPRGRWDPEAHEWDDILLPIHAAGPREAFEFEQVIPGHDWETAEDPILAAIDLAAGAERSKARRLLASLLAQDVRCLDAHGHLGSFALDYSAAVALPHFTAGVAIGERSLPDGFTGVLPWGWIDNRPFLRCLHGYGLCLWRTGDFAGAAAVFDALLWLNPTDNQGARMLIDTVRAGTPWEPPADEPDGWRPRGAGRRALLDRSAATLDRPLPPPAADALEPLRWLLEQAVDDLPLTQTGALAQRVVRDAAARFPGWWNAELFGPPHREAELPPLEELHAIARRAGLLRRRGQLLLLTRRGRTAIDDAETRADSASRSLITGDQFEQEASELACAALVADPTLPWGAVVAAVHAAVSDTWRTSGGAVGHRDVEWALAPLRHAAIGLGVLPDTHAHVLARTLRHRATA